MDYKAIFDQAVQDVKILLADGLVNKKMALGLSNQDFEPVRDQTIQRLVLLELQHAVLTECMLHQNPLYLHDARQHYYQLMDSCMAQLNMGAKHNDDAQR
jgi:hypothetical protein